MKAGNIRKIDYLMSVERDFALRPAGAASRYALLSTPRCGSNLVGDMLHATGCAGDPQEYLNARLIAGFVRSKKPAVNAKIALRDYLMEMETRRSSPNGVFGIKIHYEHLLDVWKGREAEAAPLLRGYDRLVLLSRRDKIAQAVSLYKARVTQIWSSLDIKFLDEDDPRRLRKATYDPVSIAQALADLIKQEIGWRSFLQAHELPFIELCYEDFVADYAGQSARLLHALGIGIEHAPAAPRLQRQGRENDPMIEAFRQAIGAESLAAQE